MVVHPTSQDLPTGFSEEPVPDPRSSRGQALIGEWVDNGVVPVTEMIQHLGKPEKNLDHPASGSSYTHTIAHSSQRSRPHL